MRTWLVGASLGIGYALAEALIKRGDKLVLSSRNTTPLIELQSRYPDQVDVLALDVTQKQTILDAAAFIEKKWGALDCVIYNAGISELLKINQLESEVFLRTFQTNYFGCIYVIEATLPLLRLGENPYIVGVSSSSTYTALPSAEAYGSSKAALRYFLESLRIDLRNEKIDVSVISPGFVKTRLTDKNRFYMPFLISPEKAAVCIVKGLNRRSYDIHFPKIFTCLAQFLAVFPTFLKVRVCQLFVPR